MELGKTILYLRGEKGYTQERIAEMLGVSTAAVSKWECNNAYPDITLLPKIAEIFGVSVDYLLGYDMANNKTTANVIAEISSLYREFKIEEAESLIEKTLARFPNDMLLRFSISRLRVKAANKCKTKSERDILYDKAADGFRYVVKHETDKSRRDWSLKFLSGIYFVTGEYDKASEYNDMLITPKGIYPHSMAAIIKMRKSNDENALNALKEELYGYLLGMTSVFSYIAYYYYNKGDYEAFLKENLRMVKVYEAFAKDAAWIEDELSCCYEGIAYAYAQKKEFDVCLDYLEKAYNSAVIYDTEGYKALSMINPVPDDLLIEEYVTGPRSCCSMYDGLTSSERKVYAPIRETERYMTIINNLKRWQMK